MEKRADNILWAVEAAIIIVIVAFASWALFEVIAHFLIDNP